ncbi:LexA family transcriptional regulator [Enterobacteriaceae bacterium 4M9]|nr:LexA family transcriptional regulator [Enterobacteriaceae bacterium 4M9]
MKKKPLTPEQLLAAERLKSIFEEKKKTLGLSQDALAEQMGMGQSGVAQLLNGKNAIGPAHAAQFAKILGVTVEQFSPHLANEIATMYQSVSSTLPALRDFEYPLFTTVQAGAFSDVDPYTEEKAKAWIPTAKRAHNGSFWLEVVGHSMTAPQGVRPSFPEGMLILVDPYEDVGPGDFCVATAHDDTEATFKKFTWDDGKAWLEPLNPNPRYQPILFDENHRVIGKVVYARWPDDTFQ